MKRLYPIFILISFLFSQNYDYIGSLGCKMCHKKEEKGAQFSKWESTAHAKAFETLKSDAAASVAKEKGIETPAWETPECVICHTTGFDNGGYEIKDESFWSFDPEDKAAKKAVKRMTGLQSVGCEVCHGAGSGYKSKKNMVAIYNGEIDGATLGLMEPNEEMCKTCHNPNSPTFKSFNYEEYYPQISHPMP